MIGRSADVGKNAALGLPVQRSAFRPASSRRSVEVPVERQQEVPPTSGRAVNQAQQRPDRPPLADLEPRVKLLPRPAVHPDFASLAALPAPDEHRAAGAVEVSWRASASLTPDSMNPPLDGLTGLPFQTLAGAARLLYALLEW